ncbi:substrate-binding periplasmic protein [Kiloniella laminariae]|uniref:substrate-binding periplasmic protein n=1 Tax=Kiloniella laminariae TaxID=454162 RepID=UPI0003812B8C|nr:transporter substrate-binding domain-containing protein [Kiloniella laminariae]
MFDIPRLSVQITRFLGSFALIVPVCFSPQGEAGELKLVTGNYPPFTAEQQEGGGLVTEVVRTVFARMDLEASIEFLPWKRGYVLTEKGDFAATFPYLRTDVRSAAFLFSDPVIEWRSRIFVRREAEVEFDSLSDLSDLSGLSGLTECLPHHYGGLEQLDRMHAAKEIRRIRPPFIKSCWLMVLNGRADFFIEDIIVAEIARHEHLGEQRDQVIAAGSVVSVDQGYVIFPRSLPGSERLREKFNVTLQGLADQGEIDKITKGYVARTTDTLDLVN